MRQLFYFISFSCLFLCQTFSQTTPANEYKNLAVVKQYGVALFSEVTGNNGKYEVNGKLVSKDVYDKFASTSDNWRKCTPCIIKTFGENEVLLWSGVAYSECLVGWYKEFYPNGKIKVSGNYKANTTGNWENVVERGLCSIKDKQWTYFNESGDTLYSEYWNSGSFVKQVPGQKKAEIWKVELTLAGVEIKKQELTTDQVKKLVITPKFKNRSREKVEITINFEIIAVGYKPARQVFPLKDFRNIDVLKMLAEAGIPPDQKVSFMLQVCNEKVPVVNFFLNVKL